MNAKIGSWRGGGGEKAKQKKTKNFFLNSLFPHRTNINTNLCKHKMTT